MAEESKSVGRLILEAATEHSYLRNIDVVTGLKNDFLPELTALQQISTSSATHSTNSSQHEGFWVRRSFSQVIFGDKYHAVDETINRILVVKWILEGDYKSCATQMPTLDREVFRRLRQCLVDCVEDHKDVQSLIAYIIYGQLAEDPSFATRVDSLNPGSKFPVQQLSKAEWTFLGAERGIFPSLVSSAVHKHALLWTLEAKTMCDLRQVIRAECVPGNLQKLHDFMLHKAGGALNLYLSAALLDIILDLGHGGILFGAIPKLLSVVKSLVVDDLTPRMAYDQILQEVGAILQQRGFKALSVELPYERAMLRLIVMAEPKTRSRAEWVSRAFMELPDHSCSALVSGLNVDGCADGRAVVLQSGSCLFKTAVSGTQLVPTILKRLGSVMKFLARVYEVKKDTEPGSGITVRDLEFVVALVRSEDDILTALSHGTVEVPPWLELDALRSVDPERATFLISNQTWTPGNLTEQPRHEQSEEPEIILSKPVSPANLTIPLPTNIIYFETCRLCSTGFKFLLPDGENVMIHCGVPDHLSYKAISYVWGETHILTAICRHCSGTIRFPMQDQGKFHNVIQLASAGSTVWLDALSINQEDQ